MTACLLTLCPVLVLREHFLLAIVVGDSMLPTLHPGQTLLVDRDAYKVASPNRGDIVLARYGHDLIVKRVVGLPGEEVEVRLGQLYINGRKNPESYGIRPGRLYVGSGLLLDGDFATLGDNRAIPAEVAIHPILSKEDILGKVVLLAKRR